MEWTTAVEYDCDVSSGIRVIVTNGIESECEIERVPQKPNNTKSEKSSNDSVSELGWDLSTDFGSNATDDLGPIEKFKFKLSPLLALCSSLFFVSVLSLLCEFQVFMTCYHYGLLCSSSFLFVLSPLPFRFTFSMQKYVQRVISGSSFSLFLIEALKNI